MENGRAFSDNEGELMDVESVELNEHSDEVGDEMVVVG